MQSRIEQEIVFTKTEDGTLLDHLAIIVAPGGIGRTRDIATRMRPCPAQPESRQRHAILLETGRWPQEEDLIEGHFTLMPLPTGKAELRFEIMGCQHFARDDSSFCTRCHLLQHLNATL